MRCAVVGAGAWGTALADLLARNGHDVLLWAREPDVVASVNERSVNDRFFAGHEIDRGVRATGDLADAARDADLVAYVPPSHVLRALLQGQAQHVPTNATIVVASKGIEHGSLAIMTDIAAELLGGRDVVALSGPSFAAEVADRQPTAVVAASSNTKAAELVQQTFSNDHFRVYAHDDVIGVELGGSLKNVMAVATGIAEGVGLGFNSRAALITRGLAEMTRLGLAMGANATSFAGLAGLGDLVLTCTGTLSRNRTVGFEVGKGESLDAVLARRETVAEGVTSARSAIALAQRHGVEMPIVSAVCQVLFEGQSPRSAIEALMRRDLRSEQD